MTWTTSCNRWRAFLRGRATRGRLAAFWDAYELLVRAHDEAGWRRLGRLVGSARKGGASERGAAELCARFEAELFAALARKATPRKHAGVLRHALGHLRVHLDAGERRQLAAAIAQHEKGRLPLVVPLTLVRFQARKHAVECLKGQLYLDPHPKELLLRNRA